MLLVVDYAETRSGLQGLLHDVLNDAPGPDMRVLLVARSAGEWWQQLINSSSYQLSELLAAVRPITLGPVCEGPSEQEVFHDALVTFADELGVACPEAKIALSGADAVILVIHAAALLAILDNAPSAESEASALRSREEVLAGLLRHEARYWQQSLAARDLALDPEVARRAVAVGCLIGADDEASASKLLAAIPDLTSSAQRRGQAARWLHDLYPAPLSAAPQREWIGPLSPDLIVEQLVVGVLTQHPDLIPALFTELTDSRAIRGLTVLARAALTDPVAADQLDVALRSDLEHLVVPALAVAVETNTAVGDLIKDALSSTVLSIDVLERIAGALPQSSFALAETAVIVFQRLADESVNDTGQRAAWLVSLANWQHALGRREDALAASEEAVTIYRQLAQTWPDTLLPDLAGSLNTRSVCLSDLGRREDALAAIEEALTIYQQLTQTAPDAFLPNLATSLINQSACLSGLGRREDALAAIEEALTIYRQLAQTWPDAFLPNLATSLNNQSSGLSGLGRREDALAAIEEALTIYRQLAQTWPDAFLPDLAGSLTNQSGRLSDLGRREDALAAIEEAVTIRRALAEARPDAFLCDLAMSLTNQTGRLSDLGRREDALAASEEALTIYRRLAQARPDAFLPDLAGSLINQSGRLLGLGRREDALAASEESVAIYRQLAQARPDTFLPDLAGSLNDQSAVLSDLGRREDALAAIQEAVAIRRALAQARPDAFLPDLAMSLNNQSDSLLGLGREKAAMAAIDEAVAIYRQLAQTWPDAFLPNLAMSLTNQSNGLSELGRQEDALAAIEEAVTIYRQLAQTWPDAFLPNLAASLNNQSNRLSDLGRQEDALAAIEEAVTIHRQLAQTWPDAFLPNLAMSLNNGSACLSDLARWEDALAAIEEAVTIYRDLVQALPEAYLSKLVGSLNQLAKVLGVLNGETEVDAEIVCDSEIRERLTTIGLAQVRTSLHAGSCQTCCKSLGSNPPVLVVNDMGPWAHAYLHHRNCRAPVWKTGAVVQVSRNADITWGARTALLPLPGYGTLPALIVNPSLESVVLEPRGEDGSWRAVLHAAFSDMGVVAVDQPLDRDHPLKGISAEVRPNEVAVRIKPPAPSDCYSAPAERAVIERVRELGQIVFMVTHAVDPTALPMGPSGLRSLIEAISPLSDPAPPSGWGWVLISGHPPD